MPPSEERIFETRDSLERRLARAVSRAVKSFLRRPPRENFTTITLGEMYGWWAEDVDSGLLQEVRTVWLDGYHLHKNGIVTRSSLDGLDSYMARVKDRLVRGLEPPLPEAAFDMVRLAIVAGAARGWSTSQVAEQIAASLSWEKEGDYWRSFKSQVDEEIDTILDPLGPPGSVTRQMASNFDPKVLALREQRNLAIRHLDAEESYWKRRATLIARTETTGAFNAATLSALHDEGFKYKEWLSTRDTRTRETHRLADGQTVALRSPFMVGGFGLQIPGDPTAPPQETVQCRCTLIGSDGP